MGQPTPVDGVRPRDAGILHSLRAPVSVHVGVAVDAALGQEALAFAEQALDALEFANGFAQPLPDGDRGGGPDLDVYLENSGPAFDTVVDALDNTSLWDRASAFVRVRATPDRAALRRSVAEGIARAMVLAAKADHPPAFVAAAAASMARMVTREPPDLAALRAFQEHPDRAIFGGWEHSEQARRGASMFVDYVQARWDDDTHKLLRAMIEAPVGRTPPGWERLWDKPDLFVAARRVFRDEPDQLEGALIDFSVARALAGTVADPYDVAGALDASLAIAPIATVRYGQIPRWVTPSVMLQPTGCASVEIDLGDAPLHTTMALWFHGSPWQRWMTRVVRMARDGRAVRDLGSQVIANGEWSLQLDVLDGYSRVIVVVVNLGDLGYEPDVPQNANGFFALNVGGGG